MTSARASAEGTPSRAGPRGRARALILAAVFAALLAATIWPFPIHRLIGTGWAVVVGMCLAVGAWVFLVRALIQPKDAPAADGSGPEEG